MNFLPGRLDGDTLRVPIGDVRVPAGLRQRLESGPGGGKRGVIVGIRPEQFEDAKLVGDRSSGHVFTTTVDVLEALGSQYYAHSTVESERVSSNELEELARDTGESTLDRSRDGVPIVARLGAASRIREGQEAELWFDTNRLHLFDYESDRSLLGAAPPESAQAAAA